MNSVTRAETVKRAFLIDILYLKIFRKVTYAEEKNEFLKINKFCSVIN